VIELYDRPVIDLCQEKIKGDKMKLSIVTAILDSPEILRRHILHYEKMPLPQGVEWIVVDDGSDVPIEPNEMYRLYQTNDKRPWTQPAARPFSAKQAKGEFCLFTDIDHIITKETIQVGLDNTKHDVIRFRREVAVLDENGNFTQDWDVLREWKFDGDELNIRPHGNSYIMRTGLYLGLGGVSEQHVGTGKYPNREESPLKRKLKKLEQEGRISIWQDRETKPCIYMFPNGWYCNNADKDFNPFGFFHNTTRSIRVSRQRQREVKKLAQSQ